MLDARRTLSSDQLGNPYRASDDALVSGIDDFVLGFLSYHPRMMNLLEVAEAHPESCIANAYAAMLWMFSESLDAPRKARPFAQRAMDIAEQAHPREAKLALIADAWVRDDIMMAIDQCEGVLDEYPTDLATLKLAQYFLLNHGDNLHMLRLAMKCHDVNQASAYMHGMTAFAYEQCHRLNDAEAAARDGLAIDPDEPWCHHALAHVFLTQGRTEEGIAFLEKVAPSWGELNSFIYTHNYWHLGLFYIAQGRLEAALELYDDHLWGREKTYSQDQIGAASFLARLEFAGADTGDRWEELGAYIAGRGPDTVQPFLSLQYVYALAASERPELDLLMAAIRRRADFDGDGPHAWRDVALPGAQALTAFAHGDFARCADQLETTLPRMTMIGGSHAQRELFELFYLYALIRGGEDSKAQQILETRLNVDPGCVPLRHELALIYRQNGLTDLAENVQP